MRPWSLTMRKFPVRVPFSASAVVVQLPGGVVVVVVVVVVGAVVVVVEVEWSLSVLSWLM